MARRTPLSLYGRLHGVATEVLHALSRSTRLRRANARIVSALFARTLRRLRAHPAVVRVLLRGSYVEERFTPFLSDVDIVVWLRGPGPPSFSVLVSFLQCLRAARRRDPSLRDEWQFLVTEEEWPLLAKHADLLEMDRWSEEQGHRPFRRSGRASPRLRLAHDWRRHNQWTETAMRFGLPPPGRRPDGVLFAACEKKARVLAGRLLGHEGPPRRRPSPRTREELLERAAALLAIRDRCAAAVLAEIDDPVLPLFSAATAQPGDAGVLAVAEVVGEMHPVGATVWQAGVACFVTTGRLEEGDWLEMLQRLDGCAAGLPARALPYTQRVFALGAPLLPRRTVAVEPGLCNGTTKPWRPLHLREQLISEALFVGAELRILADRPSPAEGVPAITNKLACLVAYFALGAYVPEDGGALDVMRWAGRVDDVPGPGSAPEAWYVLNIRLFSQLVDALEGVAP